MERVTHPVRTTGELIWNADIRATTPREDDALDTFLSEGLRHYWIRASLGKVSANLIFTDKKDGGLRIVVNHVDLNAATVKEVYAPPPQRLMRYEIASARFYCVYDLSDAYYNIRIDPKDAWKTAFRCKRGLYEFMVLPQGWTNSPAIFQKEMEIRLTGMLGKGVTVHLDNVLIYTKHRGDCEELSRRVLTALRPWKVNESKTRYCVQEVVHCGWKYGHGRMECVIDPKKPLREWPTPKNAVQLREFIGTMECFRETIPGFAAIMTPLYVTSTPVGWTKQRASAFSQIKAAVLNRWRLEEFEWGTGATITPDASQYGVGAWLSQKERIRGLVSRTLTAAERNYDTLDREMLAVIYAIEQWYPLLEGCPGIRVVSDHKNLTGILKPTPQNRRRNRWIATVGQFKIKWEHIPGHRNILADRLSRRIDYK